MGHADMFYSSMQRVDFFAKMKPVYAGFRVCFCVRESLFMPIIRMGVHTRYNWGPI